MRGAEPEARVAAVEAWQRNAGRRREVDHSAGRAGDADSKRAACLLAKDAAPYRHPRLVPAPAGDTHLGLPALDSAEAIADATSRVIKALTVGELSLGTAQTVVAMRGEVRQAVEPSEFEQRLATLVERTGSGK